MKKLFATLLFAMTAAITFAQGSLVAPFAGYATGGAFTWTNKSGGRVALSAANLCGPPQSFAGGETTIKLTIKSSFGTYPTQTNILARSSSVTNSLNFLDGAASLPIEALGEIRFAWPTTNWVIWSVVPKN